jgi:hypothetical protein
MMINARTGRPLTGSPTLNVDTRQLQGLWAASAPASTPAGTAWGNFEHREKSCADPMAIASKSGQHPR